MSGLKDFLPFAILGFLLAILPWIGVAGLVAALVLHIWIGLSLFWMIPPATLLGGWLGFVLIFSRNN